jgi:excisionase family DNA binding protein
MARSNSELVPTIVGEVWDVNQAASWLGVKRGSIYELVKKRGLPHIRIGNRLKFYSRAIELWLIEQLREEDCAIKREREDGELMNP